MAAFFFKPIPHLTAPLNALPAAKTAGEIIFEIILVLSCIADKFLTQLIDGIRLCKAFLCHIYGMPHPP
jgi:hypothetical protein